MPVAITRRISLPFMKTTVFAFSLLCSAGHVLAAAWQPVPGPFPMTRWAKDVSPAKVLPEYPRPQMVRKDWLNLNGLWDYSVIAKEDQQPTSYQGQILVPFPIEAPLSGVGKMLNSLPERTYTNSRLWYRRSFETPPQWKNRRTLLHFGAVDWEATVYLNGKQLGVHRGGYDGFSFDVTAALKKESPNELVVAVYDPTFEGAYPRGKQIDKPAGIYYTPCSGIWQTVWLEPVLEDHLESLLIVPDLDASAVHVTCNVAPNSARPTAAVSVEILDAGKTVASAMGTAGEPLTITLKDAKLWTPANPHLYDLTISLGDDEVKSYFGMRKVSVGPDKNGITRILLNNEFVLHNGVLDQGYWPDGIYTAPTDEALRYDIEAIKQLGFNMSRKHVKIEPERWYYWADKLGVLVWQDMPCSGDGIHAKPPAYAANNDQRQKQFGTELRALINGRSNHPCIVSWVVFNEGMGLQNSQGYKLDDNIRTFMRQMTDIAAEDESRAINAESGAPGGGYQGWNPLDIGLGQVMDAHCYGTTKCIPPTKERASVIGEYGYAKFLGSVDKYRPLVSKPGVSGLVWTQITDVEKECNGLLTYDRGKFTEDPNEVAKQNAITMEQTSTGK
jgi:beta-galactosidase/beta-glucuronidase